MLDVRNDFPFLERCINGKPVIYFDNAATTQKPKQVIERLAQVYSSGVSNVHRAVNFLADEVTQAYEGGRETVARFLGGQAREIVFVSNATQGINVICQTLSRGKPLRILTTTLEHHSNLLPWVNAGSVDFLEWGKEGKIDLTFLERKLKNKPDLVSITTASNFLGSLQPVDKIVAMCHEADVPVLLDASQSIRHEACQVRKLNCDFLVFSGHKIYGPSGIGVLYIKNEIIDSLSPVFLGGSMVKEVHAETHTLNDTPYRFEPGTPNIEGVIGLGAAIEYVEKIGFEAIQAHEYELIQYAKKRLLAMKGITIYGPRIGERCAPVVAFHVQGLEAIAVAKILGNRSNIVVRSGFHCAQPAHEQLGLGPTVRASFALYNSKEEVDHMMKTLENIIQYL